MTLARSLSLTCRPRRSPLNAQNGLLHQLLASSALKVGKDVGRHLPTLGLLLHRTRYILTRDRLTGTEQAAEVTGRVYGCKEVWIAAAAGVVKDAGDKGNHPS